MTVQIVRYGLDKIETVIDILDEGMIHYPSFSWIFSGADTARRRWLWRRLARYAFIYGEVWAAPDHSAVALWLPPGVNYMSPWQTARSGFLTAPWALGLGMLRKLLRFQHIIDKVRRRVTAGPHWYLLLLSAAPGSRGAGAGRQLVRALVARAHAQSVPCFLETQDRANVAFYQALGFQLCDERPSCPGTDIVNYALICRPEGRP